MEQQTEIKPNAPKFSVRKPHVFDPETKRLKEVNPYRLIVHNGVRYFEFPVGSGNLWWEDEVTAAGRFEDGKIFPKKAHEEYVAPLTEDQKLAREVLLTKQENARLIKELEEIKKEKELTMQEKAARATGKATKAETKSAKAAQASAVDEIIKG